MPPRTALPPGRRTAGGSRSRAIATTRASRSQIYVMNADGQRTGPARREPGRRHGAGVVAGRHADRVRAAAASSGVTASSGGTGSPLTADPADETEPDWSPDGGRIVFQRGDGIAIMRADGGAQAPLAGAGVAASARVVARRRPDRVRLRDLGISPVTPAGTGVTPLTTGRHHGAIIASQPELAVDPDPGARPVAVAAGRRPGAVDADGDGVIAAGSTATTRTPRSARREGQARRQDRPGLRRRSDARGCRCSAARSWPTRPTYPTPATRVFKSMSVSRVRKGDKIALQLQGQRAARSEVKTIKVKKKARKRSLVKRVKGAKLRNGAVLQLRITHKGTVGQVGTWRIRGDKIPKIATSACDRARRSSAAARGADAQQRTGLLLARPQAARLAEHILRGPDRPAAS